MMLPTRIIKHSQSSSICVAEASFARVVGSPRGTGGGDPGDASVLASICPRFTPSAWPRGSRPRSAARRYECACQRQRYQFGVDLPSSATTSHRRAGPCGGGCDWRGRPGISATHVAGGSMNSPGGHAVLATHASPLVGEDVLSGGKVGLARERALPAEVIVDEDRCVVMASAALHRSSPLFRNVERP